MDTNSWFQLAAICFFGAISPGPSLALVVSNTLVRGRTYGVVTGLGHGTGIGLWAFLTAAGIVNVMVDKSGSLLVLQSLGACLIAYIGFRTIMVGDWTLVQQKDARSTSSKPLLRGVSEGLLISLFNPKIALFFLAIFSHFVHPDVGWIQTGLMGTTAWVIDAGWYITVALTLTSTGMMRILEDRAPVISRISGSVLILLALYLLGRMFQYLL